MTYRLLGAFCLAGLCSLCAADLPWQKGAIVFREVAPGQSAPPGTAARLHWVIKGLPEAAEVRVPDAAAAAAIKAWLAEKGTSHDWLLDQRTDWSLPEILARDLDLRYQVARDSARFLTPPKPTDQPARDVEFPIRFRPRPPQPGVSGLDIRVATKASTEPNAKKVEFALGDLAGHVAGFGVAAAEEMAAPDAAALRSALRTVAEQVWQISQTHGIVVGASPDDERFIKGASGAEQEIAELYTISGRGFESLSWPAPKRSNYQRREPLESGAWVVAVSGVQVVREVRIEVPLVQVAPGDNRREARALQLKRDTEAKATNRLRPVLDSLRNTVPTNALMRAVRGAVEAEPSLLPPATARADGQTIVFTAADSSARFGLKTTVEGGWSAEDRLTGKGTFTGDNLFRLSDIRKNRVDSETLSFSGGPRIRQFSGSWQLLSTSEFGGQSSLKRTLSFGGQIRYDSNQLLGNPQGTRLSLDSRRIGPEYTIEYGSPLRTDDGLAKTFVAGSKTVIGSQLGYGDASRREGFAGGPGVVTSGKFVSLSLAEELQLSWRLEPPERRGIGQVRTRLLLAGGYSPNWLDYHFRRAEAAAEAEVTFGFSQSRDCLVRYRLGMAAASAGAPIFELPRLGGPDAVRGIEQGEQIGRKLGYIQITAGPSIESIVTLIRKKRPENAQLGPISLADTYVTAFADRGAVFERSGIGALLWPGTAAGYGVAVEMRNFAIGPKRGRLSLGYGYSPDSVRHPHGIPVVSLAIDLN